METSRGQAPANRGVFKAFRTGLAQDPKRWPMLESVGGYSIRGKLRKFRKNGFPLPFRSQSAEKLVKNYHCPEITSIVLT
ncbi:hypothetical protein [Mesorhizobium humile]|uniref:Uncharacterized protein n=1 Tax=Mesorhizobium humile TaxID=3072313 RepID=A0ABU4YQ77_9HYPH|nr:MULTISPECIES: hypothetical protein [unclassified Mesorhizobium]MDX8457719.1 hypothetical protein [Mesorhizobium sp. VK2D]MDX8489079.1 hypothetical protein [Mesorhizobium sp. VK2B]